MEKSLIFHNTVYPIYFENEKNSWSFKNLEIRKKKDTYNNYNNSFEI